MTDAINQLRNLALPYGVDRTMLAAESAADQLAVQYYGAAEKLGSVTLAANLNHLRVIANLERATRAIADAHAGCRRKNCRVCDNISVALAELIAYHRTRPATTRPATT